MVLARSTAAEVEPELDLGYVAELIRSARATPELMERWLHETWREPAAFRRALYRAAASRRSAPIKSRPELGLDLYTDCISSQLGAARTALITVSEGKPSEVTYEALHARSSALASTWTRAGVKMGDSLALLAPVGVDYCVALLTALRLGLVVTTVPPLGATYARDRLTVVAADHVAAAERCRHMLPADAPPPLPLAAVGGDATFAGSHAYAPAAPALRLFSPFGAPDAPPAELTALTVHEALLRDGLFVLALEPGERVAAPAWDVLQLQPLALLTTWLAGACWVECSASELRAHPGLLQACGVSLLGVDTQARELLRERGVESCRGVRSWFRGLNDRFDHEKWRSFGDLLAAREISHFQLLYNAASGGAHLFGLRERDNPVGRVWPAPGRSHVISQVGASLLPALDATGVYTPLLGEDADPTLVRMVIAKLDQGWSLGGSIDQGPQAHTMPCDEIARCARRHPLVAAASVHVLPGRWPNDAHVLMLVFVSDHDAISGTLAGEVRQLIARELGERHVPERVEIFALHPRHRAHDGDELDAAWCASQYLSGMLGRKARTPMFLTLSRLSWIFATHRTTP